MGSAGAGAEPRGVPAPGGWRAPGWGALALGCFVVHGAAEVADGHPANLLWACHLASVLIGVGLIVGRSRPIAVGFLWLTMGMPLWVLDIVDGGSFLWSSVLTHVGGVALAVLGLRRLGLPRGSWWRTLLLFMGLQVLSRVATPVAENVNVSQAVWAGWERWFSSYPLYMAVLLAIGGLDFYGWERLVHRLGWRERREGGR